MNSTCMKKPFYCPLNYCLDVLGLIILPGWMRGFSLLFLLYLHWVFTSGIPCGEKALKGGTTSETFSYPGGGGSNNDVLKI